MRKISPGDFSILWSVMDRRTGRPDSNDTYQMVTISGTPNDILWSEMVALGWMAVKEEDLPLLPDKPALKSKRFSILPDGWQPISELVTAESLRRERDSKLAGIYNRLRVDIPPLIIQPVREAGGNVADVTMMLSGIISSTMTGCFKPETHEHYLNELFRIVKDRLRESAQKK